MNEQNDNTAIKVLSFLIVLGVIALAILLYRQSKEPPIVLEEIVETIDLPEGAQSSSTTENPQ